MTPASNSRRAERVWLRLNQAYGARVIESYGPQMPDMWRDAIEDLSDDHLAYGLRKVVRDTPIHPPTLGQFTQACGDLPMQDQSRGRPSIQETLCAYVTIVMYQRLRDTLQFALPWTYTYREWNDETKAKQSQRQAECTGVTIPALDGADSYHFTVAEMLLDKPGHARALKSMQRGPGPTATQRRVWSEVKTSLLSKLTQ